MGCELFSFASSQSSGNGQQNNKFRTAQNFPYGVSGTVAASAYGADVNPMPFSLRISLIRSMFDLLIVNSLLRVILQIHILSGRNLIRVVKTNPNRWFN